MTFDVAACLDQGRPSVSHTQTYVAACHTLGYQYPDLTANGAQVLEWYGAEDAMDLAVLEADCARLRSAANAAEEALALERDAAAPSRRPGRGESASAADGFVERHCAAATATAAALRNAADSCAALRDSLWRLVGDKVRAAVAIDDRRAEVRPGLAGRGPDGDERQPPTAPRQPTSSPTRSPRTSMRMSAPTGSAPCAPQRHRLRPPTTTP